MLVQAERLIHELVLVTQKRHLPFRVSKLNVTFLHRHVHGACVLGTLFYLGYKRKNDPASYYVDTFVPNYETVDDLEVFFRKLKVGGENTVRLLTQACE